MARTRPTVLEAPEDERVRQRRSADRLPHRQRDSTERDSRSPRPTHTTPEQEGSPPRRRWDYNEAVRAQAHQQQHGELARVSPRSDAGASRQRGQSSPPASAFPHSAGCLFGFLDCDQHFNDFDSWRQHCNAHIEFGSPSTRLVCTRCYAGVPSWDALLVHVRTHLQRGEIVPGLDPDPSLLDYMNVNRFIDSADNAILRSSQTTSRADGSLRSLDRAVATNDVEIVLLRLKHSFDIAAIGQYEWLHELQYTGLDLRDIAEILVDDRFSSPWIPVDEVVPAQKQVSIDHHSPNCVHNLYADSTAGNLKKLDFDDTSMSTYCPTLPELTSANDEDPEHSEPRIRYLAQTHNISSKIAFLHASNMAHQIATKSDQLPIMKRMANSLTAEHTGGVVVDSSRTTLNRSIDLLVGIGGVQHLASVQPQGNGHVRFMNFSEPRPEYGSNCDAAISYETTPHILFHVADVLQNVCTAMALLQETGLCCSGFTILCLRRERSRNDTLVLRYVDAKQVLDLKDAVEGWLGTNRRAHIGTGGHKFILRAACAVLACFGDNAPAYGRQEDSFKTAEHFGSLATQLVCVALLSYIQGHRGPLRSHVLDTPLVALQVCGSETSPGRPRIQVQLLRLTCLDDMMKSPVVAFSYAKSEGDELWHSPGMVICDLSTDIKGLLDTLGPGSIIFRRSSKDVAPIPVAVSIGGGYIHQHADDRNPQRAGKVLNAHWSFPSEIDLDSLEPLPVQMIIGAPVKVNKACNIDEDASRRRHQAFSSTLGVRRPYWKITQRQVSGQGGQYVVGQFAQTWAKMDGISIKQALLGDMTLPIFNRLEYKFAVRVSLCTKVAQRVPLRILVADLLERFTSVAPLDRKRWEVLRDTYGALKYARRERERFDNWYNGLPYLYQETFSKQVLCILRTLENTGVTDQGEFFTIAWPTKTDLLNCLKIRTSGENEWLRFLDDSTDCASFVYVTPRCIESSRNRCTVQVSEQSLIRSIRSVSTAVSPDLSTSRVIPEDPGKLLPLNDEKGYHVEKMDSRLYVKLVTPPGSRYTHVIPSKSRIPERIWRRIVVRKKYQSKIREQQSSEEEAQPVFVSLGPDDD